MTAVGLFAGIGGVEEGLARAGAAEAELLVENWTPAQDVLRARFPDAKLEGDVRSVESLPKVDLLTAGFPCTDLSQAGRTAGIKGKASGLVSCVFDLLESADPTWLVFENVRNMLVLDRGDAMRYLVGELEERKYTWAYRLVDSRCTGVPQRRQRVIMLASRTESPADVLLRDDAGKPGEDHYVDDAFGFYWTEGLTGLGWARDAVPTL
jgi:DNA (cytosine-5)-methyltransferase 1